MPKTAKRKRRAGHSREETGEERNHRHGKSPFIRRHEEEEEEAPFDWDGAAIPVEEEVGKGIEGEEMAGEREGLVEVEMPPAAKKPKRAGLYHPPTHEELHILKETQDLFSSNLMKLQVRVLVYTGLNICLHQSVGMKLIHICGIYCYLNISMSSKLFCC